MTALRILQNDHGELSQQYRDVLFNDVLPFWVRFGWDRKHDGMWTCLDRDGTLIDTDKSIWFQGRAAWMFATMAREPGADPVWREVAASCIRFLRCYGQTDEGKLCFTVTGDGRPLRVRRYVYSEAFACIGNAVYAQVADDQTAAADAIRYFDTYLRYSFDEGVMLPKVNVNTRPARSLGPLMIAINVAQELRQSLGDIVTRGQSLTQWIDQWIQTISDLFFKPDLNALLEMVSPAGELIDHFDGRQLNPGHAVECAWFILHEAKLRRRDDWQTLGLRILDASWERGWDKEFGGLLYFVDVRGLPVQEYWHDMKFWWPHCEAIIATALAWNLTRDPKYACWHQAVHDWAFRHFADAEHGEWFGYLHRDGRRSVSLKGSTFKGPFHLPRMLWYCERLLRPS